MFCRNCGKQVESGIKFCGSCGEVVASKPTHISKIGVIQTILNGVKRREKKYIGIIACAVVLLIVMILVFGGSSLSGTYVHERGNFTIRFSRNGTLTFQESHGDLLHTLTGSYIKTDGGYNISIYYTGGHVDHFHAKRKGRELIVSQGANHEWRLRKR